MPDLNAVLDGFAGLNNLEVRRTVDRSESGLDSGETVAKAWLTAKDNRATADADALFQKEITTADVAGTGQIEDDGTGDVDPVLRFDLEPADTDKLVGGKYYSVKILTSESRSYTVESGTANAARPVTQSTS